MRTKNSRGVSALVATRRHFLPAFVLATCCRAGLSLKAEMLAGYGLCIIDADCDWALRAIGYNFKKSKKGSELRLNSQGIQPDMATVKVAQATS